LSAFCVNCFLSYTAFNWMSSMLSYERACCIVDLITFSPASQSGVLSPAVNMADSPSVVESTSLIYDGVRWTSLTC